MKKKIVFLLTLLLTLTLAAGIRIFLPEQPDEGYGADVSG